MAVILCTTVMHDVDGLPRDDTQSSLVFEAANLGNALAIGPPAVIDFWQNLHGTQITKIGAYIGAQVSRAVTTQVKTYDITTHLDGSPHGTPVQTDNFTLAAADVAAFMPDEVAICMSYHGDLTGLLEEGAIDTAIPSDEAAIDEGAPTTHTGRDRPKSRHRGRIFIGPLVYNSVISSSAPAKLTAQVQNDIKAAATGALLGLVGANWRVWSRRDAAVYTVTGGFIDNAFDTQRRRSVRASSRLNY